MTFIFIIAALLLIGGVIALIVGATNAKARAAIGGGVIAIVLGIFGAGISTVYSQDVGEAKVIIGFDKTVKDVDITPGWDFKAPWDSTEDFDIRNQPSTHSLYGESDKKDGNEITTQDANGVTANYDVEVRYSIVSDKERIEGIYDNYKSQEEFKNRLIISDIRSVVRSVPNNFSTIEVLTKRGEIESGILDGLKQRWEKEGVQVESVALQEIRYPEDVQARLKDAQNASTDQEKAKIALETAKINEQQKVVVAQAEADSTLVKAKAEAESNRIIAESLSPEVLQNRKLDTMEKIGAGGNLIITDGDGSALLNIPAPAAKPAE